MLNLSVILEDSARRFPKKEAFIFMDKRLTFAQVNAASNQVAHALLEKGIEPGDKVALSCLNLPYFPILYFGILKAGAVVVPLSVLLKKDEIAYHLNDSEAKAYFCFTGTDQLPMGKMGYEGFQQAEKCEHFIIITSQPDDPSSYEGIPTLGSLMANRSPEFQSVPTGAEDTAVIIYTSGTTGRPKGAELTHTNLFLNANLCVPLLEFRRDDITMIVLPMFHIFAMTVLMNASLLYGMTAVLVPRFEAGSVFSAMQEHKVTVFAGVPTMYWGLLNHQADGIDLTNISKHLRLCVSGGASLPVQVLKDFENKFNVPILEGYGMSEGSPVVTFNHLDRERKPGSIGIPAWGVQVKLVDDNDQEVPTGEKGELLYRGHCVMKGYYKRPEANATALKDGWMHSGDIATKDEDGYYYIVDRTKDMILRGGLNVYPREVEELMMKHEAVSLVAVIGVPDERLGEEIKACVVLQTGSNISETNLMQWTKEQIADYKYPRQIEFMDALPMSATGKILKRELRSALEKANS